MSRLDARAQRRAQWDLPVETVRLAAKHKEGLKRLGITTVGDLLMHLPMRYVDLSAVFEIGALREGELATVLGTVRGVREGKPRGRRTVVEVALFDGTGYIFSTFYNQPWVTRQLVEGTRAIFSGKVRRAKGRLEMTDLAYEVLQEEDEAGRGPHAGRIIPVHPATSGLSTTWLRRLAYEALAGFGDVYDPLPVGLRAKRRLAPFAVALAQAQFPDDEASCDQAWRRLAYEELLYLQVALAARRSHLARVTDAVACPSPSELAERFVAGLPFQLTGGQRDAIAAIGDDMARSNPMSRLLHGEVGSGKTVVATAAILAAVEAGAQAAMMAPTEVLAEQYARKIGPSLDALGVKWARLSGGTKAAERKRLLAGLASGDVSVAFGTHALIEGDVRFARLALAVVDEQHRFGVRQRVALAGKGQGKAAGQAVASPTRATKAEAGRTPAAKAGPAPESRISPHVLVMSATPIPRTLAMTLYGDMDISILPERPAGAIAAQVTTKVCDRRHRRWAYGLVHKEIAKGRQAFIVCPLVDPSDKLEVKSVTREMERLRREEFFEHRVGLLHGKMPAAEKEETMRQFVAGELDVMVTTTVIEVGIDVENASVMLIEDAERFGLAQLHQLRGRVGRGEYPGWCLLFADPTTEQGVRRMEAMQQTSDGFALAELDLEIRGPGEVFGPRQSGLPDLRAASLGRDRDLLAWAHEDARHLVEEDPKLEADLHAGVAREVRSRFAGRMDWLSA